MPRSRAGREDAPNRRARARAPICRSSRPSRDGRRRTPRVPRTSPDRAAARKPSPAAAARDPATRTRGPPSGQGGRAPRLSWHEPVVVAMTAEAGEGEMRLPAAVRPIVTSRGVTDLAHAGARRRRTGEAAVHEAQEVVECDRPVRAARGRDGLTDQVDVARAVRVVTLRAW